MQKIYDLVVVGGGPGGYTAALYAARAGLHTLVLEKLSAGGQMALSTQIENYPGFSSGVDGFTLGEEMRMAAERFGAVTEYAQVSALQLDQKIKTVTTSEGTFYARAVVIATGANPKTLGIPEEQKLVGRGVNYCASCDGMFYKGKTVAVIGGGNSAVADALVLSRLCKKVYLVHRRDTLRATKVYHAQLEQAQNIQILWNSRVEALQYADKLTGIVLADTLTGNPTELSCDGVFISIGRKPATELVGEALTLDENGYIVADETTQTSLPGVFAVGDVRTKAVRQIVTAVADGAVAAHYAEEYLLKHP